MGSITKKGAGTTSRNFIDPRSMMHRHGETYRAIFLQRNAGFVKQCQRNSKYHTAKLTEDVYVLLFLCIHSILLLPASITDLYCISIARSSLFRRSRSKVHSKAGRSQNCTLLHYDKIVQTANTCKHYDSYAKLIQR